MHLDSHFDRTGRIATDSEPPLEAALGMATAAWETLMAGFTTVQTVGATPPSCRCATPFAITAFPGPAC